ncbi:response regulator transcription factor [Salisediminibacterium halotolerans]|uniref:Two-component system, OmpR family, response regulator CssR n=1 Tax=Salisediminibacterium halotolerans TaxID=517425 RepID=A0A1H9TGS5_9BACI|nr:MULTISPECIES: response regulator transcription factor [Salisediminibacterium]RLJ72388.1 two-component system response regulator CssR [Actinophytocola xinjiangensis]RPE85603.1 two-component system response regulator CssR [Salisediminibacterium halotolerans]TWG33557.1 two-component system response regulator CssR [Salisediminibacterium halotolerans]SER96540.1 two-component system, OmpR family, response regulator CssR [Salisediminibacterium haloalkalitolerans]GEL08713.1 DNA-binding response reg
MSGFTVYLVEDEQNLGEVIKAYMEKEGWSVVHFTDGNDAYNHIHDQPHLWVLDIMLPGMDGYQLLKSIRQESETPCVFISARDQDLDRVLGLELGSDDYLAKPFMPEELMIRVKKLLHRAYPPENQEENTIELNDYLIDTASRTVTDHGEQIELTTKEMDLIILLSGNVGKALSREEIIEYVWGEDYFGSERAVDDVVRRVRKKLPRIHVETLYGYGYRVLSS